MFFKLLGTNADWGVAIVRIILGIVFFAHGAQKMLGWFGGPGFTNMMRTLTGQLRIPAPFAFLVIAGEFFGGLGLVVGLLSRLAAIGVLATMAGAVLMVHLQHGLFLNWFGDKKGHGIEYHLLAMALALIVLIKGAGAFSLDRGWYQRQLSKESTVSQIFRR
ncbi:MAG: DoxX family protein [Acidobacteriia bacterium]|nr:DoxX family protein [Terriglobia bacterium]